MDWQTVDYFGDAQVAQDPYEYFEALRAECPVLKIPELGVVAVTGYDELSDVYRDTESFSSANAIVGPFAPFPVPLEGDDISDLIAEHRHHMPMWDHIITMDPPEHTRERAVLSRLLTPKRLKDNEDFMWHLADQQLDWFLADGACEFITAYAQPFAMLVIADVLGVPEEDHERFRQGFGLLTSPGAVGAGLEHEAGDSPLAWLDDWFARYIEDRRATPQSDVLTNLAQATYPDGSIPDVAAVVRIATLLFAAGQETTARLLGSAMRVLGEEPETQDRLRADKALIPTFLEEVLRLESPIKTDFRLAKKNVTIGGVDIAAGMPVMMLNGAANRDPRHFECPHELQLDRVNAQSHIAFGRGIHSCPGGSLARAEGRISLERILDRTRNIRLSEEHHGPVGDRRFQYSPTWLLRGLDAIHIEFDPI